MIRKIQEDLKYKKIIISGANGFTGRYVCKELISRNIMFSVILRPGSCSNWMKKQNIPFYFADLNNIDQLSNTLNGNQCLINIASIGFGSASSIIKSCKSSHIKRVVFISSTSIFTQLNSRSKKVRIQAENLIIKS